MVSQGIIGFVNIRHTPGAHWQRAGRNPLRQRLANWLGVIVLLSLGFVWPSSFAAELDDIRSGTVLLKSAANAEPVEALRVSSSFRVQVTGNVARVHVVQEFTNPSSDWVEGLYVFPLSSGSAVDELLMHVGDRVIRGDIQPKAQARATYENARSQGRRASLVDQERPNMFSTSVANIAPASSLTVEIAYFESIPFRDSRYTLHLPLAITPRYNPNVGIEPSSPHAAQLVKSANAVLHTTATPERVTSAAQKVDLDIQLSPGFPLGSIQSLHHPVTLTSDSLVKHIVLQGTEVPTDRDFELVWTEAVVPEVSAAVFMEQQGAASYALLMLTPPAQIPARSSQPREVEFIIDTSGSMFGPSIEQARAALQLGVDRLADGDRFNVIRFSSDASSLFQSPQPVDPTTRALASRFIASLSANGGTEMRAPLEMAFATPPSEGMLRQIVFITDGGVSNEAEIISLIRSRILTGRLFTVGIGAAPNAYFLQEAAAAGRGSYTFIAQRDQVRSRMQDLFSKLESPVLVNLHLEWPHGISPELAAELPTDLYAGDPVVVLARLAQTPSPGWLLNLSGQTHGASWVHQIPITTINSEAGIAKLWARERIAVIARDKGFGGDPAAAEASILALALQHHLVSDYTSLIAVDATPVRPPGVADRTAQAPTSAPIGSYWAQTTGFAQTATAAPLLLLVGGVWLAFALILYVAGRRPAAAEGEPAHGVAR